MPSVSGNVGAVASVSSVFGRNGGVVAANGDYSGVVAAHLTGATAATRYVGGTASGAPVAGTFAVGDFVIEQTGKVYVCTVAGTPGTWVAPGGSLPDPITQPVTIALPHGDAFPLSATADDVPNALINGSIGLDGTATLAVLSGGTGNAVLEVVDVGTKDGQIKWETQGSYLQPRSDSADSAQTIEMVDTSGNDALVYQAGGSLIFGRKTVIPDSNLAAGQFGFWLDDTNGAAKLMVKAKSANGTVVTAAVALS